MSSQQHACEIPDGSKVVRCSCGFGSSGQLTGVDHDDAMARWERHADRAHARSWGLSTAIASARAQARIAEHRKNEITRGQDR